MSSLENLIERRPDIPGADPEVALGHAKKILSLCLHSNTLVLNESRPVKRKRAAAGGNAGGSSRHLPGYVNLSPRLYRRRAIEYISWAGPVDIVCINPSLEDNGIDTELAGDAPTEDERPILALYDPTELRGAIARARTAERIRHNVAQRFSWDIAQPTPQQIKTLLVILELHWQKYLDNPARQENEKNAQLALIVETMLLFGKSIERARRLTLRRAETAAVCEFALLVEGSDTRAMTLLGWRLPVIEPEYQTKLPTDQLQHACPRAKSWFFPDRHGLGKKILDYCRLQQRKPNEMVFTLQANTVTRHFKALVGSSAALESLTPTRIERVLATTVFNQTGDWALAWHVAGDEASRNEPRMFYAAFPLTKLAASLEQALDTTMARIEMKYPSVQDNAADIRHAPLPHIYAGPRFVAEMSSVKRLVEILRHELSRFLPAMAPTAEWVRYHNLYTLYTWLVQSLNSGLRAINDPSEIIEQCRHATHGTAITLSDKETEFRDRARPIKPTTCIGAQIEAYRKHIRVLIETPGLDSRLSSIQASLPLLFSLSDKLAPEILTRAWVEKELAELGFPFPGNFSRAFLRTELVMRLCSPEEVDAFLGHANFGERPFSSHATFDYARHFTSINDGLKSINGELRLAPLDSRLQLI